MVSSLFGSIYGQNKSTYQMPPIQSISTSLIAAATTPQVIPAANYGPAVEYDPRLQTAFRAEQTAEADTDRYVSIRRRESLLDENDSIATTADEGSVENNLFLLSKMLGRLQSIARYAESGDLRDQGRHMLNKKLEEGMAEFTEAYNTAYLGTVDLAMDRHRTSIFTKDLYALPESTYNATGISISPDAAVSDLPTDAAIDIQVTKDGSTNTVTVDLQDLDSAGKDRSLENIAEAINDAMTAAGYATSFSVISEKDADGNFTNKRQFSITPGAEENIVFKAANNTDTGYWIGATSDAGIIQDSIMTRYHETDGSNTAYNIVDFSEDVLNDKEETIFSVTNGPNGDIFAAGKTEGDVHTEKRSTGDDVFIGRYNSAGEEVWRRSIGLENTGKIHDTITDASGNLYVAGEAVNGIDGTNTNTTGFIQKYKPDGTLEWSQEITGNNGNATALALSIASDGSVQAYGSAAGGLTGTTGASDLDGFSITLSNTTGAISSSSSSTVNGTDSITAATTDSSTGMTYLGVEENGTAYIRALNSDGSQAWQTSLGTGSVMGIETTSTGIAILTNDTNSEANIRHVSTTGTVEWSQTIANGSGAGMDVYNDTILITGDTTSSVDGGTTDATGTGRDVWSASYSTTGTQNWIRQHASAADQNAAGIVGNDSSWLEKIGLAQGMEITSTVFGEDSDRASNMADSLVAQSDVRVGDSFSIKSGDKTVAYTMDEATNIDGLLRSIRLDFGNVLETSTPLYGEAKFTLSVKQNREFELISGPDGSDALAALALEPQTFKGNVFNENTGNFDKPAGQFSLGIPSTYSLDTDAAATEFDGFLIGAQRALKNAYQYFTDPVAYEESKSIDSTPTAQPSAYQQQRMIAYQDALNRISIL